MVDELLEVVLTPPDTSTPQLELRATAQHSREQTMNQISTLLRRCCGHILEECRLASGQSCRKLEVPRSSVFKLYSGLLAAELDLCRDSHLRLTGLCTLRLYRPVHVGNISMKLELAFSDEIDVDESWAAIGFA